MRWAEPAWSAAMPLPWYVKSLEFRWKARACSWGDREWEEYKVFLTSLVAPHGPAWVEISADVSIDRGRSDRFGFGDLDRFPRRPEIALSCRAFARVAVGVRARSGEAWIAASEEQDLADKRLVAIGAALNRVGDFDRNVVQEEFEPVFDLIASDWRAHDERPEWWTAADGVPGAAARVAFGAPVEGGRFRGHPMLPMGVRS